MAELLTGSLCDAWFLTMCPALLRDNPYLLTPARPMSLFRLEAPDDLSSTYGCSIEKWW